MQKKILIPKRYMLIFLLILLTVFSSMAQSQDPGNVNSTGSTTSTHNNIIYEWSVGELVLVETMINNQVILTNGFTAIRSTYSHGYRDFCGLPN